MIRKFVKAAIHGLGLEIRRPATRTYSDACVTLKPSGTPRGRCLIAYILQPFLERDAARNTSHTHFLESCLMAEVWTGLGYEVDVIDYRHAQFQPARRYDFFVSARKHLADIAPRLNQDCIRIAHLDTAHYAVNNAAAYQRLVAFQNRRGTPAPESIRLIEHNRGIDAAHYGVLLGSAVTRASYAYARKPVFLLDVPAAVDFEWNAEKDFAGSASRFLWLGSSGLLHKGLDLVIEAFLETPELELNVCGPLDQEPAVLRAYERELKGSSNIRMHGWVDVGSSTFRALADRCASIVYPSCGEGQAGSVVTALRAGLVPLVSPQSGVDPGDFGEAIAEPDPRLLREAVTRFAALTPDEIRSRARKAWEAGVRRHSPEAYRLRYEEIVRTIVAEQSA